MSEERRLDGNALAGALAELLVPELTAARGRCGGCGAIEALGADHVYAEADAPGAVLRCRHCESVLAVVVRRNGATRFAFGGLVWIEA